MPEVRFLSEHQGAPRCPVPSPTEPLPMPIPSLLHRLVPMALATALMTLGGCTTGPKVQADHDRSADFSRYKTFGFFNPLGTLNIDLIDLARQQMVWEGVVTSSVTDKDTTNLAVAIDGVVSATFNLFPIARPAATPAR